MDLWTCAPPSRTKTHHHCTMFNQTVINLQKFYLDCCIIAWSDQGDMKETPNNLLGAKTGKNHLLFHLKRTYHDMRTPNLNIQRKFNPAIFFPGVEIPATYQSNMLCILFNWDTSCSYQGDNVYVFHQSSRYNVLSILGRESMNYYILYKNGVQ